MLANGPRKIVDDSQRALAEAFDAMRAVPEHMRAIDGKLVELVDLLRRLVEYQKRRDTKEIALLISTTPVYLQTYGYRHNRLFAKAAGGTVNLDIAGQRTAYTVVAGWNATDWPENTIMSSSTVGPAYDEYVLQLTDEPVI